MSKLALKQGVPVKYDQSKIQSLFAAIENQVNSLAEGRIAGRHFTATSVPTTGSFAVGDIVWNASPTVSSAAGSVSQSYVVLGWVCTAAGSPGTLKEIRALVADDGLSLGQLTSSLAADVALNNTANYFDGPSVAQGTSGTWFVSGTVTFWDTAGAANFDVKLWDGTNVIASAAANSNGPGVARTVALSGFLVSPAGNVRISVKDLNATTGVILFNQSGNSKDSTITAFRLA